MPRAARRGWGIRALRAIVIALVLPLASAGALPLWAMLLGVEAPHVCHCSLEQHDCVCAKCHADVVDEELRFTTESLKGRCGDDDVAFGGKALAAVLPPSNVLAPVATRSMITVPAMSVPRAVLRPPPTPPPRVSSSTAV